MKVTIEMTQEWDYGDSRTTRVVINQDKDDTELDVIANALIDTILRLPFRGWLEELLSKIIVELAEHLEAEGITPDADLCKSSKALLEKRRLEILKGFTP